MTVANTPAAPPSGPMGVTTPPPPDPSTSQDPTGGNPGGVPGRIIGQPPAQKKPITTDALNPDVVLKNMNIPPQLMPTMVGIIKAGMNLILSPQTHHMYLEELKQAIPNSQKLANGILNLMILLSHESRGALPPQLFIPAAIYLLVRIAQYTNKNGLAKFSNQDIAEGIQIMIHMIMQKSAQGTQSRAAQAAQGHMGAAGGPQPAPGQPPAAPPAPAAPGGPPPASGPAGAAPQPATSPQATPGMASGGLVADAIKWMRGNDGPEPKKTAAAPMTGPQNGIGSVGDDRYRGSISDDTPNPDATPRTQVTAIRGKERAQQIDDVVNNAAGDKGMKAGGMATGGQADTVHVRLSHGEYVIDADTVAALGDGNTAAGAAKLKQMVEAVRAHKRSAPANSIPPKAKSPAEYMKQGK